jgi:hypothetical protein
MTTGYFFRDVPMEECPCVIPDENDNCVDCGKHIELPDAEPPHSLGDIGGICRLLDTTAKTYAQRIEDNTDPKNPMLPRLRLVGGQLVRVPHKAILKEVVQPSFKTAKALGYRGTAERWAEMVIEATPSPANTLSR